MYLALIPDEQTIKALRAFAPALPSNAHCTIIHSKTALPVGLLLPEWPKLNGSYVCAAPGEIATFGGKYKVQVLKLALNAELEYLRSYAEAALYTRQIPWSKEWAFSPHVTLGRTDTPLVGEPPVMLRFDRMEWHP